jgi:hypothetical protein
MSGARTRRWNGREFSGIEHLLTPRRSLEEFDNLPMFDEDLEAALEQFRESSRI